MSVSAFPHGSAAAAAPSGPFFNLTGVPNSVSSTDEDGFNVTANVYVDRDGDMRERRESIGSFFTTTFGSYSNGDNSDSTFGDSYHVRMTHQTGPNNYQSGSGLASWLALTADRSWQFNVANGGPNTDTSTYLVEFSDDAGSTVLDSFTQTVILINQSP